MSANHIQILKHKCAFDICFGNLILNSTFEVKRILLIKINFHKKQVNQFIFKEISSDDLRLMSVSCSNLNLVDGNLENISSFKKNDYLITAINSALILNNLNVLNFDNIFIYVTKSSLNASNMFLDVKGKNISRITSFIISEANRLVYVVNSSFINFNNQNGGAITNSVSMLFLQSNIFYFNDAQKGGALYTMNSNVTVNSNYFVNNSANYGGAIYFTSDENFASLNISNNNFTNNFAQNGGGAFYTVYNIPLDLSNSYIGNRADYGNNYASPPVILKFNSENLTQIYNLSHYLISTTLPFDLEFYLIDIYHNAINSSLSGKAIIQLSYPEIYQKLINKYDTTNIMQLSGQLLSDYSSREFVFRKLSLNFKPNSVAFLSITSDIIQKFVPGSFIYEFPNYIDALNNYYYILMINSTDCAIGDFFFKCLVNKNIYNRLYFS